MGVIKSGTKIVTFPFRKWIGTENLGRDARGIKGMAQDLGVKKYESRKESFEAAMKRMNLTEADIQRRKKETYISAWIYFTFFIGLLVYAVVLAIKEIYLGVLLCSVLSLLGAVLAGRESFWYMQMSQRKLGCTFGQWFRFITRRKIK